MKQLLKSISASQNMLTLFIRRFLPLALFVVLVGGAIFLLERSSHLDLLYKHEKIESHDEQSPLTIALERRQIIAISAVTLLALIIAAPITWFRVARQINEMAAEHKNRENLRSIKLLLDSTIEGIYGTDKDGRCILANRSCAHLLGYSSPELLLGKNMHQLMHHSYADGTPYPEKECKVHRFNSVETTAPALITNEVFWRQDGSSFPASYTAHPIQEDGKNIGVVCTFMDISDRLLLEEQLRHAQKMETAGQLAGGIAHDFNNILQIISGNTQILECDLKQVNLDPAQLQEIHKAVERGTTLTRSMLAFNRKQTINSIPLELNQLVKDSHLLAQKLLLKGIKLKMELAETALVITADEVLLQQVLFNLITNARDAMPTGGTITIATAERFLDEGNSEVIKGRVPGDYAVLMVRDTGQGIPEKIRQNIFEPFFTTKEVGKGTGLGLAMVYGTVKEHGGFVQIESKEGYGSCFSCFFPALNQLS